MWIFVSAEYFFFNDTATTEIYTLSLHDALPIYAADHVHIDHRDGIRERQQRMIRSEEHTSELQSHSFISYAVFCLKTKTKIPPPKTMNALFSTMMLTSESAGR